LVTDRAVAGPGLLRAVEDTVAAGVDRVQVRERALGGAALAAHVREIAVAARAGARRRGGDVAVLVNRFVDVALATEADGVHLGFDALAAADARSLLGPGKILSVACHTAAEVHGRAAEPIDAVQLAPIFAPRSKAASRQPLGLEELRRAARGALPVIAQGGIDCDAAAACIEAGAAGVAVTGALLQDEAPAAAAAALRNALDAARRASSDR
jgi:thiamine-phosphate diphosphorylase